MKKKVLVLAAVAAMIVGIFTISTQNKSLSINQAQAGPEVVACPWSTFEFCVIEGEWFLNYYPIIVDIDLPTEP